jgi:hypothetical protein
LIPNEVFEDRVQNKRVPPMIATILFLSNTASAKDLDGRIGVGINTWFGDIPAISVRYSAPTMGDVPQKWELQAEGLFGYAIDPSERTSALAGVRILSGVVVEDNLNLMAGAGAGFVIINETLALRIQPAMEIQYFLFGLEFLSFNAGLGMDVTLGSGENGSKTSGAVLGGFHYWF